MWSHLTVALPGNLSFFHPPISNSFWNKLLCLSVFLLSQGGHMLGLSSVEWKSLSSSLTKTSLSRRRNLGQKRTFLEHIKYHYFCCYSVCAWERLVSLCWFYVGDESARIGATVQGASCPEHVMATTKYMPLSYMNYL